MASSAFLDSHVGVGIPFLDVLIGAITNKFLGLMVKRVTDKFVNVIEGEVLGKVIGLVGAWESTRRR